MKTINERIYSVTKNDNFGEFYIAANNYNLVREAYPELPEMTGEPDELFVIMPKELVAMCQFIDALEELGFEAVPIEAII